MLFNDCVLELQAVLRPKGGRDVTFLLFTTMSCLSSVSLLWIMRHDNATQVRMAVAGCVHWYPCRCLDHLFGWLFITSCRRLPRFPPCVWGLGNCGLAGSSRSRHGAWLMAAALLLGWSALWKTCLQIEVHGWQACQPQATLEPNVLRTQVRTSMHTFARSGETSVPSVPGSPSVQAVR